MRKLFKRFSAYFIDMLVVILIVQSLSGIPQINRQLDDYNKYQNDYLDLYSEWGLFKADLNKYYEDKELTSEEYDSLVKEHEEYIDILNKYYKDGKLVEDNYDKLNKEIDKNYEHDYKDIYYKMEKNSIIQFIIYLVVVFLYFVGFNIYTNGQTLGKKLTRLKIVNSRDENREVPWWSYVVRTLILYQPIYYMVRLVCVNFMSANMYYDVTSIFYNLQGYLEMLIIAMVMIRIDGRGPQDILARTRVAMYDRNGEEIVDKVDLLIKNKKDNSKKKVIDEEPSK